MPAPVPEVETRDEPATRIRPFVVLWLVLDAVMVSVFAVIGRTSHGGSPAGFLEAAWPFLLGLGLGWLAVAFLGRPGRSIPSGLVIWAVTVVTGALLRVASGSGAPLSFLIVTGIVLLVLLLGWRLIGYGIAAVDRRRNHRDDGRHGHGIDDQRAH